MAFYEGTLLPDIKDKFDCLKILNLNSSLDDHKKIWSTRTDEANKYLKWCLSQENVAVTRCDVPEDILPNGRQGTIYDIRVKSPKGPDDAIYDASEELRTKVARGNTIFEVKDGPQFGKCMAIHALKKFTGGEAFDDDDRADELKYSDESASSSYSKNSSTQESWKLYFTKSASSAVKVVSTRKANGEAAHLACVSVEGVPLIVVGSKNTHIVVRNKDDIDKYTSDRERVARMIAKTVFNELDRISVDQSSALLQFLILTRFTAVFEILCNDHQHIENFSHMKRPELKFITWTSTDYKPTELVSLPPNDAIDIARCFGLDATIYQEIPIENIASHKEKIRRAVGYEGEVFYYIDKENNTIGLVKLKTVWYILCRAIREKAKSACFAQRKRKNGYSEESMQQKMSNRLNDIEKWLELPKEVMSHWRDLAAGFLRFVVRASDSEEYSIDEIVNLYPLVWADYLKKSNRTDHVFL